MHYGSKKGKAICSTRNCPPKTSLFMMRTVWVRFAEERSSYGFVRVRRRASHTSHSHREKPKDIRSPHTEEKGPPTNAPRKTIACPPAVARYLAAFPITTQTLVDDPRAGSLISKFHGSVSVSGLRSRVVHFTLLFSVGSGAWLCRLPQ